MAFANARSKAGPSGKSTFLTEKEDELFDGKFVTVTDSRKSIPLVFQSASSLGQYLKAFPEAENDQSCRLFKLRPDCPNQLLNVLSDKFEFYRFGILPPGLLDQSLPPNTREGVCRCPRCKDGDLCGEFALHLSVPFICLEKITSNERSQLIVEGDSKAFTMAMYQKKLHFRIAKWDLFAFILQSQRRELTDKSLDVLMCSDLDHATDLHSVPIDYVLDHLENVVKQWPDLITSSTEFLQEYRLEIMGSRLEKDRSIIRNLLRAASFWELFRKICTSQLERFDILTQVDPDDKWIVGSGELSSAQQRATSGLITLRNISAAIDQSLIRETDVLIQRITNLIQIEEGYTSRDQNASIRRLSWITFVFLPLVFTASLFGMNVSLLENFPSWVYFIYVAIILAALVSMAFLIVKFKHSLFRLPLATYSYYLSHLPGSRQVPISDVESAFPLHYEVQDKLKALCLAATIGSVEVLRALVLSEKKLKHIDKQQHDVYSKVLICAVSNRQAEAAEFILPYIDDVDFTDEGGATALHHAAQAGLYRIVQGLLSRGSNKTKKDNEGLTALDWVNRSGIIEEISGIRIRMLLQGRDIVTQAESETFLSLQALARQGDTATLRRRIEEGASVNHRDSQGRTALIHAVQTGHIGVIRLLLSLQAQHHAMDHSGLTALHHAVEVGNVEAAKLLIQEGADVNARSNDRETPLMRMTGGSKEMIDLLHSHGTDLNACNRSGQTILHLAMTRDTIDLSSIEYLILKKASLLALDTEFETVAHTASRAGRTDCLRLLVNHGADLQKPKNREGQTPILVAAKSGQAEVIRYLVENGVSPLVRDNEGRGVTELAVLWNQPNVLAVLRRLGISYQSSNRDTDLHDEVHPIWNAVRQGDTAVARELLNGGCDVNMARSFGGIKPGISLLQTAIEANNFGIVQTLLDRNAKTNTRDFAGWTPLHSAAFVGNAVIVGLILPRISDISSKDLMGWTALDLAVFYRHSEVVELLNPGRTAVKFAWMEAEKPLYNSGSVHTLPGVMELEDTGKAAPPPVAYLGW